MVLQAVNRPSFSEAGSLGHKPSATGVIHSAKAGGLLCVLARSTVILSASAEAQGGAADLLAFRLSIARFVLGSMNLLAKLSS